MLFGLVTKRVLDERLAELSADVRRGQELQKEIEFEWARWFNKFRTLYAMLLKREKKLTDDAPGPTTDQADVSQDHPARAIRFPNSRRGF